MTIYFTLIFTLPWLAAWGLTRLLARQPAPSCRSYALAALAAAVLPLFLIPLVVLLISAFEFSGTCYGFTDGGWSCTFSEFFTGQLFWGSLIFSPGIIPAWIGSAIILTISWVKRKPSAQEPSPD